MTRCFDFSHAILRRPGRSVVDGLRSHDGPGPVYECILAEHEAYANALRDAGLAVDILGPLEDFPDSVFVEDPALVFSEGAILLNPGTATRNGEGKHLLAALDHHFANVVRLDRGFADGGDVMVTPQQIMIGLSNRTDPTGARCLAEMLQALGYAAQVVQPPEGALHLKTIASLIDEETMLTTKEGEASGLFARFRQIVVAPGEEPAANALRVNNTLLLSATYPRIAEALDRSGYTLALLDTTHINRIDAGLSCMSLRWRAPSSH
jgi:dimethylargininase